MKKALLALVPVAMILAGAPIHAQTVGRVPPITVKCADATGTPQVCGSLGGGAASGPTALKDSTGSTIDPATKQNQASQIATLGAPTDAKSVATDATAASQVALLKGQIDRLQAIVTAIGAPYQAGGALPLPAGAATSAAQTTNTSAITATQAAPGALATSAHTVTVILPQLTPTAGSATSFGTTAATLFAANANRHFMTLQVQGAPDTTGTNGCWINGIAGAAADGTSLFIARGSFFESTSHVGTGAISIVCSATLTVYSRQG